MGFGVAAVGLGLARLRNSTLLAGAAFIGFGVALVLLGVGSLRGSDPLGGAAFIAGGVAVVGGAVPVLSSGRHVVARIKSLVASPSHRPTSEPPNSPKLEQVE